MQQIEEKLLICVGRSQSYNQSFDVSVSYNYIRACL